MDVFCDTKLEKLISEEINSLGFEFIGLEFDRYTGPNVLRIYADAANGITIDDCGKIGYHLNKVLSIYQDLGLSNYVLEVSSPGLERRLFTLSQYEKFLGRKIKIKLKKALEIKGKNSINVIATLKAIDLVQGKVLIEPDGLEDLYLDFNNIAKSNLIYCSKS